MKNFAKSSFSLLKSVILTIFLAAIVIFMINNREIVSVDMFPLPLTIETRLFLLMALCFLSGILFGFFIFTTNHIKGYFSSLKDRFKEKNNNS
jgi:uncharacterized integral membrane protein